jgi:hypothetical protein
MQTTALIQNTSRPAQRSIQLVLVRANGPLFYSVAAASLMEALTPLYAQRLHQFFGADQVFSAWMDREWLPAKAARAAALRDYIAKTWPEFDWAGAYEQCRAAVQSDGGLGPLKQSAAHEALASCIAAAQSGVFYRALSRWADDPQLRDMAAAFAPEEALAFSRIRAAYDARVRVQRFGLVSAWRTASACMRSARDLHLAVVFKAITAHVGAQAPFPVLEYVEFVSRMRSVIERHGELGSAERILLRTWKKRPRIAQTHSAQACPSKWFRPVLQSAATLVDARI